MKYKLLFLLCTAIHSQFLCSTLAPSEISYSDIQTSIKQNSIDGVKHALNTNPSSINHLDWNPDTKEWTSLLHLAAQEAPDTRIMNLLMYKGLDPESITEKGHSVRWYIIMKNTSGDQTELLNFINQKIEEKNIKKLKSQLQKILDNSTFKTLTEDELESQETCPICTENLYTLLNEDNKLLVRLNCGHVMCSDELLDLSKTLQIKCPLCRTPIRKTEYVVLEE